jgi:hypothetical protein
MPKYVIERDLPGIGSWSAEQLRLASRTSCEVLKHLGPGIEWLQSYVTNHKLYSIYNAPNEEIIREHGRRSGFPADSIQEVRTIIGPFTAERKDR